MTEVYEIATTNYVSLAMTEVDEIATGGTQVILSDTLAMTEKIDSRFRGNDRNDRRRRYVCH